jgi:hypothetical protein
MPGLVPGIHVLFMRSTKDVDGRDEPGHDEELAAPDQAVARERRASGGASAVEENAISS